jgi:ABC-type glycerol-3-phosphate transport system substrate-binding protein
MYHLRNLLFASLLLVAVSARAATEINYWLWDVLQLPAYQAAAAAFEKANPDIKVKITQTDLGGLLDEP